MCVCVRVVDCWSQHW